jgi:hypothetical protein
MKKLVLLGSFILLLAACLTAQETTGRIVGTITDATGAVVPNAKVTATNDSTGLSRETVTGSQGDYRLGTLPPGTYTAKVEAKGFTTTQQKGIVIEVGREVTLNQSLKPGGANEIVEVTSEPAMIETTVSNVVGVVTPAEVSNLPIQDRNFSGLEQLVPGVRNAETFDPTKTRVGNISVNGGDGRQVDTSVDGGDNKDLVVGGLVQNFTLEGIQEFNVQTNRYTAEAGHSVAAVVNVVTKSGTNNLHGSAFGLFGNSGLNKNDSLTLQTCTANGISSGNCPKELDHTYHYGASFGGPIIKDKLFFFGAFENKREAPLPTINSTALSDLTTFAAQTAGFPGGPYAHPIFTIPAKYIDWLGTGKLDWTISPRQNLFVRYGRQKWTAANDQVTTTATFFTDGSQGTGDTNQFHDLSIQHNFTISPTKVNSFTAHFQDFANKIGAAPTSSYTYPVSDGSLALIPNIVFPTGTSVGLNVNVPQETLIRKYQFADVFTWTKGAHNLKFGGNEIYFAKMGGYFFSGLGYFLTFNDDPVTIANNPTLYPQGVSTPGAVAEMTMSGGSGSTAQPPWNSLGFFVQDDWKATRNLTLNLGLRWDANIGFLQPQLGNTLTDSNRVIYNLRQAYLNPNFPTGDPGAQYISSIVSNPSDLRRTTADYKEFQPRLGFAWDITGTGKHVLRGGYGIARDQIFQNITLFAIQQTQQVIYQTVFDVTGGGPGCAPTGTQPVDLCTFRFGIDPLPAVGGQSATDLAVGSVGRIVNPHITDPWSQQFGLGYAWQITNDYAFSADYVHIIGTHEERVLNVNPTIRTVCNPAYGGDPTNPVCVNGTGTRLMDYAFQQTGIGAGRFAQIYDYSTNNRSFYDGINLQLRKRFSNRIQFQVSDVISWSRSWGGFPVASYGGSGLAIDPANQFRSNEFGDTNFDERNRLTFSGVFNLPKGFSVSPFFTAASAKPYSFLAGGDVDGDGRFAIDRACVGSTPANPITDPLCNQLQPNTLRGKAFIQMNLRADKQFNLGEHLHADLYWEFYNLFNRSNYCNSYGNIAGSANFGQPLAFCSGPITSSNVAAVSGFSTSAIPSLSNQFGFRFTF